MSKFKAILKILFAESEDKPMPQLILSVLLNGQVADGTTANSVQVNVVDDAGAPLPGAAINFVVDAGVVSPASAQTDANGLVAVNVTSTTVGELNLTATLADGTASQVVQLEFVAVPAAVLPVVEPTVAKSPLEEVKAKFEAFVSFVEHGVEVLGKDAEAELVALKDKYL